MNNKDFIEAVNDRLSVLASSYTHKLAKSVTDAMCYSLSAGGKRLRPMLAARFYELCSGKNDAEKYLDIFCTMELIHTFSLIHDDLPCMDNDDYRRGMPSCHKAFPEAIALLAGDALNTLAFEIIADKAIDKTITYEMSVKLSKLISNAVGTVGMIGGQVIDMESEGKECSIETLNELQRLKTGALIKASCVMGCILANADDRTVSLAEEYAENIGLAFQIQDDILDVISTTEELGKPVGSDSEQNKTTYVSLLGIDNSREKATNLTRKAVEILKSFDNSQTLIELTEQLLVRKN